MPTSWATLGSGAVSVGLNTRTNRDPEHFFAASKAAARTGIAVSDRFGSGALQCSYNEQLAVPRLGARKPCPHP